MKKLLAALAVIAALVSLSGCPKKESSPDAASSEPVEGSSTTGDKSGEGTTNDEMQEKKGGEGDAAAPAEAPAEAPAAPAAPAESK